MNPIQPIPPSPPEAHSPATAERKRRNRVEKTRMDGIRGAYRTLSEHIPERYFADDATPQKRTKLQILKRATQYINDLDSTLKENTESPERGTGHAEATGTLLPTITRTPVSQSDLSHQPSTSSSKIPPLPREEDTQSESSKKLDHFMELLREMGEKDDS